MATLDILIRAIENGFLPQTLQSDALMVVFIDPDECVVTCPINYSLIDDDGAFELLIATMRTERNRVRSERYKT